PLLIVPHRGGAPGAEGGAFGSGTHSFFFKFGPSTPSVRDNWSSKIDNPRVSRWNVSLKRSASSACSISKRSAGDEPSSALALTSNRSLLIQAGASTI